MKQLNTFTPTGMLQMSFRNRKLELPHEMEHVQQRLYTDLEQTRLVPPEHARQAAMASRYPDPPLTAIH